MAKMSYEKIMEKAWELIGEFGIVDKKIDLTEDGYLVSDITVVRDAFAEDIENGHDFHDDSVPDFFARHGIEYADADDDLIIG